MTRTLFLAVLMATGVSFSALAADETTEPTNDAAAVTAYTKQLSPAAEAESARRLLQAQGYSNVSDLQREDGGRWTGTAMKEGKIVGVSIALPPKGSDVPAAN